MAVQNPETYHDGIMDPGRQRKSVSYSVLAAGLVQFRPFQKPTGNDP